MSALVLVLLIVGGAGLAWAAFKLEPHWSSKDGHRMMTQAQGMESSRALPTRWLEVRVTVIDSNLIVTSRGLQAIKLRGTYIVTGKSPTPPKNRQIYVLQGEKQILLRIPNSSRSMPVLDALLPLQP